ncbi:MAG: GntR family transcriptional regulator [Thiothrix sp.]|nr:GntR family transcriptional regulator [Thiothrix sp.]HPE60994.1 GntR family transcriptional regulator [Thiolinea sp.]
MSSNLNSVEQPDPEPDEDRPARDEEIYEHVFDALLEHKLAPGTRLSEDRLGQAFGVSRTIIRKVLQRLEHEGVVEIQRNRGAMVAQTSRAQVGQLFEARRCIERTITRGVCQQVTPAQIGQLRALVQQEQQALDEQDRGRALRLSGELHLMLAEYCGNEFLAGFARSLISRCSLAIAQYEVDGHDLCSCEEHYHILDAINSGDADQASQLMDEHILHIRAKMHIREEDTEDPATKDIFAVLAQRRNKKHET